MQVSELLVGYAVGGPRNGVKLSAGYRWDGRVRRPPSKDQYDRGMPYPGRYVFDSSAGVWVWEPEKEQQK